MYPINLLSRTFSIIRDFCQRFAIKEQGRGSDLFGPFRYQILHLLGVITDLRMSKKEFKTIHFQY